MELASPPEACPQPPRRYAGIHSRAAHPGATPRQATILTGMTTYFGHGWEEGDILLRRDLVASGFTDADLHALVDRGLLRRMAYGVLAVGQVPADPRIAHAQRAAGQARLHRDGIALTSHSALAHHDLPLDGYVDMHGPVRAARLSSGTSSTTALQVCRPRTPPPVIPLEGGGLVVIPVVAALQLAHEQPLAPAVVVLDACLSATLFTVTELRDAAARMRPVAGVGRARTAVRQSRAGAQSPRETELRLFVEGLGYETETQFPICDGPDEPPFAYTDLRIKGSRAVIEYDGEVKYETGTAAPLLAERSREQRILRAGWGVGRVVAHDLRNRRALAKRIHDLVRGWPEAA